MDPHQHRLGSRGDVAAHDREVRLVVAVGLEREAAELAELGRETGVGDAVDDHAVSHGHAPQLAVAPLITRSKRTSAPSLDTEAKRPRRSTSIVGDPGPLNSPSASSPPNTAGARYTT